MLDVKIVRNVVKGADGQVQLEVETKQGPALTAVLREVAPEVYSACEYALNAKTELMRSSEAERRSRFWGEDSIEDCAMLLAAWHDEVMARNHWMVRSRLDPWIRADVYVISPYLDLVAAPLSMKNGFVLPCGVTLRFGPLNRLDVAKIVILFPDSQHPDSWQEAFRVLSLLGDENTSTISALYCLQDRFSREMATLQDKLSEEIRQADVTLIDCEASWEYFKGQFQEFIDQTNEGRWEKLRAGLP